MPRYTSRPHERAGLALMLVLVLAGTGCSTRPRYFTPQFAAAPEGAAMQAAERAALHCDTLVRQGHKGNFGNAMLQVGGGTAMGIGAGAVAASAAASSASGLSAIGSTVAAGTATLFMVGPLAAFGISRAIRSGREKKHRALMNQCLTELGYAPTGWTKTKRPKRPVPDSPQVAATPVVVATPVVAETPVPVEIPTPVVSPEPQTISAS